MPQLAILMYVLLFLLPINMLILMSTRRERKEIQKLRLLAWRFGKR